MLAGLSSHVELLAHSSYISYVGKTNILTSEDVLGLFDTIYLFFYQSAVFATTIYNMDAYASYTFVWYLKSLPNFNIVFINISFQLSCNFTHFLGIYQEILLSCIILTYLCKIHNGVDFFVGSPVVTRPDNDNYTFHNVKFLYDISSCPYDLHIFNYSSYILTYVISFSSTTCQENVFQITMKMHGSNLIHFTFMAPAVKFLHFMKTYSNY